MDTDTARDGQADKYSNNKNFVEIILCFIQFLLALED